MDSRAGSSTRHQEQDDLGDRLVEFGRDGAVERDRGTATLQHGIERDGRAVHETCDVAGAETETLGPEIETETETLGPEIETETLE